MTAIGELRQLTTLAARFDAAARRGLSTGDADLAAIVSDARAVTGDVDRADAPSSDIPSSDDAAAAVHAAHVATARAVVALAARQPEPADGGELRTVAAMVWHGLRQLPRRVRGELRHIYADRPHSVLIRLVITLGVSLGLIAFYEFSGKSNYTAAQLMLYFYSAMVGSVVCTNALCFEAGRTRALLRSGQPVWRILVIKNISIIALMLMTGAPAIALLVAGPSHLQLIPLIDQFLVMIFTWMGIANVLSVISPLRREPFSARLTDGTWRPFLMSFAVSYGVGLTVNLMIFWQLWARQAASDHITGGALASFALVLASSIVLWWLLSVFASVCAQNGELRRVLDREMVEHRKT